MPLTLICKKPWSALSLAFSVANFFLLKFDDSSFNSLIRCLWMHHQCAIILPASFYCLEPFVSNVYFSKLFPPSKRSHSRSRSRSHWRLKWRTAVRVGQVSEEGRRQIARENKIWQTNHKLPWYCKSQQETDRVNHHFVKPDT